MSLIHRARQLRKESTPAERRLWALLRSRQLANFKFRRQHDLAPFIVDFYCPGKRLVIEVDGGQHFDERVALRDEARTRHFEARGVRVVRFTNRDIFENSDGVLEAILVALGEPSP